ncbi:uncharacterized protein LOC124939064 [Impatiens glandulifera]|uniref:uncharacterized protein LOC124939064 n=1 Tax=Impatiens glandulifera TaxID=253017 RepID=UPI001FB06AAE|nr:uncharacterized protein LOC124939064 [Impatiens glandulifera]
MEWSPQCAQDAYLDTLRLCNEHRQHCNSTTEPDSKEFISALAAGMNAKLIVEVTSEVSTSTIALAAAARQTGGKLVCILPEPRLDESQKAIHHSGLDDLVEFRTEDPETLLPSYENIDFSLVDCKADNYNNLLKMLDVNPTRSVVVADNLIEGRHGLEGHVKGSKENKVMVRSTTHPIGQGMEVTMIGKGNETTSSHARRRERKTDLGGKRNLKSKWIVRVDEKNGEEHIFRMPQSPLPHTVVHDASASSSQSLDIVP